LQAKELEGNDTNSERELRVPQWDDRGGGMERGRDRREQWGGGREGRIGPFHCLSGARVVVVEFSFYAHGGECVEVVTSV
jgi:hypothetical protein